MEYRIKRGDQEFGPYSLADLQQYVRSGNIDKNDLAKSEGMDNWVPVSQVLGDILAPVTFTARTNFSSEAEMPPSGEFVALPPNLHWGWVLVLNIVTRSVFNMIWALIQANWARKLSGKNTPMVLIAMYPASIVCGVIVSVIGGVQDMQAFQLLGGWFLLMGLGCMIFGVFKIKDAMEEYYNSVENMGLYLSGVMTFFFSVIYLQYHINRIARWKREGVFS